MQALGRTLLHASLIGLAAGCFGALFFAMLELGQRVFLEELAGYLPLRAQGEVFTRPSENLVFRPWLLALLPGLGGLAAGLIMRLAPEIRGGGGNAAIAAFHEQGGVIRPRVVPLKALATIFTLCTGGAGGREGPTMQIGAAIGSLVGRALNLSARERRILMVAGIAAGISAVFRTPLGAALLAVEVLYRDDLESDALVPAVLASVLAYSIVSSLYGESLLFARGDRYVFQAAHLPLFLLLAIIVAAASRIFLTSMDAVASALSHLPIPWWCRPAAGGLLVGIVVVPLVLLSGNATGVKGHGLGLLGASYGAAQMAITTSPMFDGSWRDVQILLLIFAARLLATSLTIGSGGSAGDFGPSLILGALLGGAFGRACRLLFDDPTLHAGAFALVGMGTFYGGIAHVPLAAIILVCELAGSYELLVPLMLAQGVAFALLRHRTIYSAQRISRQQSMAEQPTTAADVLTSKKVGEVMTPGPVTTFTPGMPLALLLEQRNASSAQDVFPVVDDAGVLKGIITAHTMHIAASNESLRAWAIATDLMHQAVSTSPEQDVRTAARIMLEAGVRQLPVVDAAGHVTGLLDENAVFRAYLGDVPFSAEAAAGTFEK